MTPLLSVKQVQERLSVDRITVYRMLQDGRLRGVKVGGQWRFDPAELERITAAPVTEATFNFPVHCAQTIQALLSGVGEMSAVMVDNAGQPVTQGTGGQCVFPGTDKAACKPSWEAFLKTPERTAVEYPAGVHYAAAPIRSHGNPMAWVLVGGVLRADCKPQPKLEEQYPLVNAEKWQKMQHWAQITAQAVESILSERSGFLVRLQKISDLTQVG